METALNLPTQQGLAHLRLQHLPQCEGGVSFSWGHNNYHKNYRGNQIEVELQMR